MVFVPPSITMAQEDEPTKDWRLYTEIPSANEFMARFPPRLPLLEESGQMTKGQFLETLYRLSRFEATEPLRRAIQKYRDDPRVTEIDDVQIHAPVNVIGYNLKHIGVSCRIALLQEPSYPEFSGNPFAHLTSGSLVVLSPLSDGFTSTCLVATVLSDPVDDTASPVIELSWAHESEAIVNTNLQLVMLEPKSGYFESLCHTMLGLQQAASLNSRFDKYLFHNAENTKPPDFLRETSQNCAVSPSNAKLLDPSQLDAFKMAINRELFVVQGPPGTGKTFTSIVTVESFVQTLQACQDNSLLGASDPFPPIVIAAQTNHAVDQLLARCMESGVGEIARLGGRSQDDIISERTVANLRRHFGGSKINQPAAAAFREHKRNLCKSFEKFHTASLLKPEELFQEGLITEAQLNSIINFEDEWETNESPEDTSNTISKWLDGYIQQREYQRAQQQEAAKQQGPTPKTTIGQAGVGKGDKFLPIDMTRPGSILKALHREDGDVWKHRAKRLLDRHSDLYEIKPAERGAVYCYLYEAFLARSETEIRTLFRLYNKNCRQVEMTRQENDISVIRAKRIQILGCTTTGLVKYRGLFLALQPRIMLIEEAAETREGNIVASLFPSLEQLVLVGDHQQLTPHADLRELQSSPHRLNYSLFERLINMKVNYCALQVQRRMIPSLREVVQVFYPSLKDHDLVKKAEYRPRVPGMDDCPLWWFEHQWTQHRGAQFSYSNPMEADMIIGFCRYLVQSGVRPGQITILVYYMGQADLVRSKVEQDAHLANLEEKLSISTIDGFQGEENDIILLSLVRGADVTGGKARPGFVADENRAVVATSRAKRGFYIFGDAKNVMFGNRRSRETWGKVIEAFGQRKGKFIPIQCSAHGTTAKIAQPEEWRSILADGCACRLKKPRANLNSAKRPSKAEDLTAAGEQSGKPMVTDAERSTTGGKMLAKYQTSDEIMAMGMRNLFTKQSTEEVPSDSNSEGDVLISLE